MRPCWLHSFVCLSFFSLITIALFILLGELLLSVVVNQQYRRDSYYRNCRARIYSQELIQFDSTIGFRMFPNLDIRLQDKEYDMGIQTNSLGLRDDEISMVNPAILFLGDSFCFGWGVDQGRTCADLVEKFSGSRCLNFGTSGYGTWQQYLLLENYSANHSISGTTLVFLVYPSNDLVENRSPLQGLYPSMIKQETEVLAVPVFEDAYQDWMDILERQNSSLFGRISYIWDFIRKEYYMNRAIRILDSILKRHPELPRGAELPDKETLFRLSLEKIRTLSDNLSLKVHYYLIPTLPQLEDQVIPPDWETAKRVLAEFPFPVTDLSRFLDPQDYYALDAHWNAAGHQKAAAIIQENLFH